MKRTILAPGHELLSYRIHEVTPYINWIYFFHAWGFQPRFAAIANIHGCDSCRALWLTTFPEEERTKASEAMQLFKEANRMLDRLDETISIHCIFRLCQANADGDNKEAWGYAPDESLSIPDLLVEKYQGIRPAVGYPSLPDQSVNFLLDELLGMKQIGITLTEHGAMHPHSSVCGMMLAHPASRYFAVGKIGEDQLEDYARRRGMPIGNMRKFLAGNLESVS